MFDNEELNAIEDENARRLIERLMNIVEKQSEELRELKAENQRLRDEINRMKGEQDKPKNKGNRPQFPSSDHLSEIERKKTRSLNNSTCFYVSKRIGRNFNPPLGLWVWFPISSCFLNFNIFNSAH